jgi:hypothetical protein
MVGQNLFKVSVERKSGIRPNGLKNNQTQASRAAYCRPAAQGGR